MCTLEPVDISFWTLGPLDCGGPWALGPWAPWSLRPLDLRTLSTLGPVVDEVTDYPVTVALVSENYTLLQTTLFIDR